jgi:hypothetical protein
MSWRNLMLVGIIGSVAFYAGAAASVENKPSQTSRVAACAGGANPQCVESLVAAIADLESRVSALEGKAAAAPQPSTPQPSPPSPGYKKPLPD